MKINILTNQTFNNKLNDVNNFFAESWKLLINITLLEIDQNLLNTSCDILRFVMYFELNTLCWCWRKCIMHFGNSLKKSDLIMKPKTFETQNVLG